MAFDKNGQELFDYTYAVAKVAVAEGRDELVFYFRGAEYFVCVSNDALRKDFAKKHKSLNLDYDNPFEPYWCCCTKQGNVLTLAPKERIMEKIIIDGQKLEDIWSEIVLL